MQKLKAYYAKNIWPTWANDDIGPQASFLVDIRDMSRNEVFQTDDQGFASSSQYILSQGQAARGPHAFGEDADFG